MNQEKNSVCHSNTKIQLSLTQYIFHVEPEYISFSALCILVLHLKCQSHTEQTLNKCRVIVERTIPLNSSMREEREIDCIYCTDVWVVTAGISVTWNVLSWSGGHEFEPRSGRTWGAWYFCPKPYFNQTYIVNVELGRDLDRQHMTDYIGIILTPNLNKSHKEQINIIWYIII